MIVGDGRFPILRGGQTRYLPFFASHDPGLRNKGIRRIVIAIHGTDSDMAEDCLRAVEDAADAAGPTVRSESLIIAPQNLEAESTEADFRELTDKKILIFGRDRFIGDLSDRRVLPRISSFAALDELLTQIVGSGNFPRVMRIVILGQSGGGRFVNRYAASSPYDFHATRDRPVPVRYVILNAGDFLYFSDKRRVSGSKPPGYEFSTPSDRVIERTIRNCTHPLDDHFDSVEKVRAVYNRYGAGLEELCQYQVSRRIGPVEMRSLYSGREVIHLVGEGDTAPFATGQPHLLMQGRNHVERAHIYFAHLMDEFAGIVERQHFAVVPGVAHDGRDMICSPLGREWIFRE